jgi:hypothetical protein
MTAVRPYWEPFEGREISLVGQVNRDSRYYSCLTNIGILEKDGLNDDTIDLERLSSEVPSTDHCWVRKLDRLYLPPLPGEKIVLIGATIVRYFKGWTVDTSGVKIVGVIKSNGELAEIFQTKFGHHLFKRIRSYVLQIANITEPELNVAMRRALICLGVRGMGRLIDKLETDLALTEESIHEDFILTGKLGRVEDNVLVERVKCFLRRASEGKAGYVVRNVA